MTGFVPTSPFAVLGAFLPQKQFQSPDPQRGLDLGFRPWPASAQQAPSLGPGQPASCHPLYLFFSSLLCCPSLYPTLFPPAETRFTSCGGVSNRMPSPSCLMRLLGWSHSCA